MVEQVRIDHINCPQPLAAKIFYASEAFHLLLLRKNLQQDHLWIQFPHMARICLTSKLIMLTSSKASQDTVPTSEAMKASSSSKPAQEMPKDRPSKPSHIEMGRSVWKQKYLQTMKKLGYFSSKVNVQLPAEQTIPTLKNADIIVYRSFFKAGLRLPMYQLIAKIFEKYDIFMHQLTLNAIVRLGAFILAMLSQGGRIKADVFCRIHYLHYQTKARVEKLHNNFRCYNFVYRKYVVVPVLAYRTKQHGD